MNNNGTKTEATPAIPVQLDETMLEDVAAGGFTGGVFVAAGDVGGDTSTSDTIPTESVSFNYTKITWTY